MPNVRLLNGICLTMPMLHLPETPEAKPVFLSQTQPPPLGSLRLCLKKTQDKEFDMMWPNFFSFPGSVSKYLNSGAVVFLNAFFSYLAKYHQEWLTVYLFIGSAPVLLYYWGDAHLRKSVSSLSLWASGLGMKAKEQIWTHLKWLNGTSLLVFFFGVLSPVIINTVSLLREKTMHSGTTDKPPVIGANTTV